MSSIESPELKTVDAHSQELTIALSSDPVCVAAALIAKKFTEGGIMFEMLTEGDTPTRQATILIESVRKEIEDYPEKFTQFLEILSEQTCAKESVETLRSTYQSKFDGRLSCHCGSLVGRPRLTSGSPL